MDTNVNHLSLSAFRRTVRLSVAAVAACASLLAGCGGGGGHATSLLPSAPGGHGGSNPSSVGSATATFTFTFPKPTSKSQRRAPKYLSSATQSITVLVTDTKNAGDNSDIYGNVPAALKVVQYFNPTNLVASPITAGTCGTDPSNAGNYECIATFQMPIGKNTATITSWDHSQTSSSCTANTAPAPPTCTGNVLSSQSATFTTAQGVKNTVSVSLDANAGSMAVTATSGYCAGSFTVSSGGTVGSVGTSPVPFNVSFKDPASRTIVNPGEPTIEIQDNTSTYQTGNGTINGTGGTVAFAINQSAQSFTLTPSNSSVTGATVHVKGVPAHAGDGLSFAPTLNFTFSTGPAPPGSFLAVIEQNSAGSAGQISFYTVTLGTSDSFTAYSTPTLSAQPAPGPANSDVDYPQDLAFDGNGDLLIANGGSGNPDFGNFACVPAGSITTGANNATILTAGVDDPTFLAFNSDSSVAVGNTPASTPSYNVADFLLNGVYTAAPASDDISPSNYSGTVGTTGLAAIKPAFGVNPAGSYVAAIDDGQANSTHTQLVVVRPGQSNINITNSNLAHPEVAYDPANHQIVAGDGNTPGGTSASNYYISFFDASTDSSTPVQQFVFDEDSCYSDGATPYAGCPPNTNQNFGSDMKVQGIQASSTGYIALYGIANSGNPEVWVLDNTSGSRKLVFGPIPYDSTTAPGGATFGYGSETIVEAMRWLTGTKLLVSLASTTSTRQGIYTYDVTQSGNDCPGNTGTCYDFNGIAFPNGPKQTGFLNLSKIPLSAAYKP